MFFYGDFFVVCYLNMSGNFLVTVRLLRHNLTYARPRSCTS